MNIGEYTLHKWGEAQTARYIDELEVCCQTLADNPALGRLCDDVRPGLRRHEHGKHVVFYRQEPEGIMVSRILQRARSRVLRPLIAAIRNLKEEL